MAARIVHVIMTTALFVIAAAFEGVTEHVALVTWLFALFTILYWSV
ncbi:hypothetical protein [Pseudothermotoga sp.]